MDIVETLKNAGVVPVIVIEDEAKKARIDRLHVLNQFKLKMMPSFDPEI